MWIQMLHVNDFITLKINETYFINNKTILFNFNIKKLYIKNCK